MRLITLVVPLLTAGPSGSSRAAAPQQPSASATELAIIAAAIDSLYMNNGATRVVIVPWTAVLRGDVLRDDVLRLGVSREAADEIARRSTVSVDIRGFANLLTSRIPVSFADSNSVHESAGRDPDAYWKAFFADFPGAKGLITVGRPGISADGQNAVLRIGMACGGRCGAWGYALLRRMGEHWHVTRFVIERVS